MSDPDIRVEIQVQDVTTWLATDHPAWATATRFHARTHARDGVVVLTATSTIGVVGYAVFDRQMSHLHYIETRKDCRRRGVASRIWARVREEAMHRDITACADTEDGKRRLGAWGFVEADGMWTFR
jgi:ribosomal protein S18 acetylase RimI-like enzyme